MKNKIKLLGIFILITLIAITMSCSLLESLLGEEADTTDNNGKVVEAIYRFNGGLWSNNFFEDVKGAVSELGETTFTVYGGGVSISFTSVYTEGGGIFKNGDRWAYLYDGSGKIGFVTCAGTGYEKEWQAVIGKTLVEIAKTYYDISAVDTNGMQNTRNGFAAKYPSSDSYKKVVEAIFRFSSGEWLDANGDIVTGAVSALGETTFTVYGGGVNISFTNVYTEYGGEIESGVPWAYLYDGSGKIGFVTYIGAGNEWDAFIGKTCVEKLNGVININTTGMQNTHNGIATK